MTTISFTPNLLRHVETPSLDVQGDNVRLALENYFTSNPKVRSYILDDQGNLRKHIAVFLNNELIQDRTNLSDAVSENDNIFVIQALTGG